MILLNLQNQLKIHTRNGKIKGILLEGKKQ